MRICFWIGHDWEMANFGSTPDPDWAGGEGPPPIVSSWQGECKRCGCHRYEEAYKKPVSVQGFIQRALRR